MSGFPISGLNFQGFNASGQINALGTVATYAAGTSTPIATYQDAGLTQPNLNPIPLSPTGQASIWLTAGLTYKFIEFDVLGNQCGFADQIPGGITAANLTTILTPAYLESILTQTIIGSALYPQTPAEAAAGVTPVNLQYETTPLPVVLRYGGDPTGVADSRAAFNSASTVNVPFVVPSGTYLINSNVTISPSVLFEPGAILKPASGVIVTLSSVFQAGINQVFDLSLGGLVALPQEGCGEVWAEWWGMKGLPSAKVNNEVPFNQAWYALLQTPAGSGVTGGTILFDRGDYFISGVIYHSDSIVIRGRGFFNSLIKANNGTWGPSTQMMNSQNAIPVSFTAAPNAAATSATLTANFTGLTGTYSVVFFEVAGAACEHRTVTLTNGAATATWAGGLAQNCTNYGVVLGYGAIFNCRVENCRLDAADNGSIGAVINAPAWQEKCGTDNVYINNFKSIGIALDETYLNGSAAYQAYGGPAQVKLRRTELFPAIDCFAGSYAIYVDMVGTVGWYSVDLEEVNIDSNTAPITFTASVGGAAAGTLTVVWPYVSGTWCLIFSDGEQRNATMTNGSAAVTWAGNLNAGAITTAYGVSPNSVGIGGLGANGRIIFNCNDVHFESMNTGFQLQNSATIAGTSLAAGGTSDVTNLVVCTGSWTGTINMKAMRRGGAQNFIVDGSRGPYALANVFGTAQYGGAGAGGIGDEVVWPPDPNRPIGSGSWTIAAGVATLIYQTGSFFSSGVPVKQAAGQWRFTAGNPNSWDGLNLYDVVVTTNLAQNSVTRNGATNFDVFSATGANVATDPSTISVKVYHSP